MAKLLGVVVRVEDRSKTEAFYSLLGLITEEHRHESGPLHVGVTPVGPDFVFEVYNKSQSYPGDALMVGVADLPATLRLLGSVGVILHKEIEAGKVVYVKDPDGRDVILVQL